jgi:hypothetical protein
VNVHASPGNAAMTATWSAPAGSSNGIDGYGAFAYDSAGAYTGHYAWVCATCTTGTITGLTNGGWYYANVFSHSAAGWGGYTSSAEGVTVGAPTAPTNVAAIKGYGQVTVTWSPSTGASAIDGYALLAFDANGYAYLYSYPCATCTSGTVTGLTNGKPYTIMVYAHNTYGWSSPTATSQFVPGP